MIPWTYQYGDKEVKVTAQDVIDALAAAESVMLKETETNEHIKGNVQMKLLYEHHMKVLSVTKDHFSEAVTEDRKKHVHMKVVGGQKK